MLRIMLFLATNFAIVLVLGVFLNVILPAFGVQLSNTGVYMVLALAFGMGGSFISLMMSKWMAKRVTGAQVITQPKSREEQWLLQTVERLARDAGIGMPEVAVYGSPDVNAFATGASKNDALVAVSAGLLRGMNADEAEAVLAHEVSHIANGDMVTMALVQGVLNTFVIFFARIVAEIINGFIARNNEDGQGLGFFGYMAVVFVMETIFGVVASIVAMWFSRQREFRADAGSAQLVGPNKMIAALQRLKNGQDSQLDGQLVAFGIKGKARELFASHPSLDDRIEALRQF